MKRMVSGLIRSLAVALIALLLPAQAMAEAKVTMQVKAEKEVVVMENGKKVTKRVAAKDAMPGEVIFYTVAYSNSGDKAATGVAIDDPLPSAVAYIDGSVFGPGAEILFSIDGGKSFKKPSLLTYEIEGKKRVASPEQYTHIRWVVEQIDPGKSGQAGFRARVK